MSVSVCAATETSTFYHTIAHGFGYNLVCSILLGVFLPVRIPPIAMISTLVVIISVILNLPYSIFTNIFLVAFFALIKVPVRHLRMFIKFGEAFDLSTFEACFRCSADSVYLLAIQLRQMGCLRQSPSADVGSKLGHFELL